MTRGRPNLIVLLSDDQGPWALGAAGNAEISTPHLDALAARGSRLDRFFCASPVCSPARASLMTGRIPSAHGVHDWLAAGHSGRDGHDHLAGQPLFTDAFAAAGWRVGLSGKWHLGASDQPRHGFDHWFALDAGGTPYDGATFHRHTSEGVVTEHLEGYVTDTIAADAIDLLEQRAAQDEPFVSLINFTAPHSPWTGQHPAEFTAPYEECRFDSCPDEPLHPWTALSNGVPVGAEPDRHQARVGYFAAVTAMDAAIGRILDRVESLGLADSTMIIFSSDNGFNLGHHGVWGKGNGTWPLNMYDSSVMVPFLAAGPDIAQGVRHELTSALGVAATVLELCGLDPAPFEEGPGRSFAPVLSGGQPASTGPVVVHDEYGGTRMMRTEQWKLVVRHQGPGELYDLNADPDERHNLIDEPQHADRVHELHSALITWFDTHADPRRDGFTLPVSGSGQLGPTSFAPGQWDATVGQSPPNRYEA
ncbi:sulfatase family protein [Propionibacteriaceae bacterium Y1685]|uniref:sulfatase family protein n=1 Tax=Microlunatus sp. Y1700 TaxID=3418487 RepID=UPI003B78B309